MPQATEELRAEWGIETEKAIKFLENAGFVLRQDWQWERPKDRYHVTGKEHRAIWYLVEEWDFGGIYEE